MFEKVTSDLKDFQNVIESIEGIYAQVKVTDPTDPNSIQAAIDEADRSIDDKVGAYAQNPFVIALIKGIKDTGARSTRAIGKE